MCNRCVQGFPQCVGVVDGRNIPVASHEEYPADF